MLLSPYFKAQTYIKQQIILQILKHIFLKYEIFNPSVIPQKLF
jgi:hypothetical protein